MTSSRPPRLRDTTTRDALLLQHRQNLRQLDPGLLDGRHPPLRPVRPILTDGDDDEEVDSEVRFLNSDHATCYGPNTAIVIPLTHTPEAGSEQVFYNGTPLKWSDWSRTDRLLTIPGELWFRAGKVAWVDYAYYNDDFEPDPAMYDSVSFVVGDSNTSIPFPGVSSPGDLLMLQMAVNGGGSCTDSRFTPKYVSNQAGTWIGIDDGSGIPASIHMDSAVTGGAQDSVAVMMRIKGWPLLPTEGEQVTVDTTSGATTFVANGPTAGTFGIMGVSSLTGLVSASIGDDTLGHWTTRQIKRGNGPGRASVYVGTSAVLGAGSFNNPGSGPAYYAWAGGLQ